MKNLGGVTCICHDTGMCHYFGYFIGLLPDFWVPFWAIPVFFGIIFLVIPRFLGVVFFVKFDFFKNKKHSRAAHSPK